MKLSTLPPLLLVGCLASHHPAPPPATAGTRVARATVDRASDAPGGPVATGPATPVPPRFAQDGTDFAADLWSHARSRNGNLALSPASIWVALGMTYGGARGQTAAEMRNALHFGVDDDALHPGFQSLIGAWRSASRQDAQLKIANRLFGQRGSQFVPAFLDLTRDRYAAPLEPTDFAGNPDGSRVHINSWVADQTNQRIRDLLPRGSITPLTRMVLTNAIWFKGKWRTQFDAAATYDGAFQVAPGRSVQAPLMTTSGAFGYAAVDGLSVLELPYRGDRLVMDVLLPDDPAGLAALEARMNGAALTRWLGALAPEHEVDVTLPRFKVAPAESLSLKSILTDMGMPTAFTEGVADFSGMSAEDHLFIYDVIHKAFVEVNEEGTEAAAATAVIMNTESASLSPSFRADHPFLFVIRDTESQSILFLGRVADPTSEG